MTVTSGGWQPGPIPGFQRWTEPGRVLVVADPWVEAVSRSGLAENGKLWRVFSQEKSQQESQQQSGGTSGGLSTLDGPPGRGPTVVVSLPGSDSQLHLRPVRHGGWLGGILRGALFGLRRPLDELRVTASLAKRGAPVPRPALVIAERSGPFWNATVGTVFEPDTLDGISFLSATPEPASVLRAAAAAGRAIRCFHEHGGSHADLHIGNLLVRIGPNRENPNCENEVVVVDLDRAQHGEPVRPSQRMRELMRLQRSLIKRGFVETVGARGYARFFAEYTGGDRQLRDELLSHLSRERLRIALHKVFYAARS